MRTVARTSHSRRRKGPASRRVGWRSYAYLTTILLLGYLCVGVQLDYGVEKNAALSRLVPPPFRAEALTPLADAAIAAQTPAAVSLSKRLVEAQPVAAENLSRLARAYALDEDATKAQEALLAAASRGWRDPLSQIVILESAILTEEWEIVAQRLSAMRKLRFPREVTDPQLQRLASIPQGREKLAEQLAADTLWQGQFARYALDVISSAQYRTIFSSVLEGVQGIDCSTQERVVTELLRAGAGKDAKSLWRGSCVSQLPGPGGFVSFPKIGSDEGGAGFGWSYPRQQGLSRTVSGSGQSTILDFRNSSRLRRIVAQKFVALEPGRHTINLFAEQVDDQAELNISVVCTGTRQALSASSSGVQTWVVDIPVDSCGSQWLRVTASPGRGRISRVETSV